MSKALALVVAAALAASAWTQGPAGDAKALDGKWTVASAELSGEPLPKDATKAMRLNVMGEKYQFTEVTTLDQGTIKIDAAKMPKAMDIIGTDGPNKGKTFLAIYDIQADTLRICYDLSGKARPTEFATKKGAPLFLVTYQRAK